MTYQEAVDFWFARVNFEQKTPRFGDFKLDRMRRLLQLLGNPQALRIVHITGSKGKGSTSALLESILRQAGYRVGLFTSPHLVQVEERIQVDRVPIAGDELAALLTEVQRASAQEPWQDDRLEPQLTFFEVATAVGFLHFQRRQVDVAVLEVGLGGRFDSTNVCEPLVSIVASISLDHTQMLGDTLAAIAREKAGIIKPATPALSGVKQPEAQEVIREAARAQAAPLRELGVDFDREVQAGQISAEGVHWPRMRYLAQGQAGPWLELGLFGEHQADNAALALACVEELRRLGLRVPDEAVRAGLARVAWPARFEIFGPRPLVILDCAHNVASAQALAHTLRTCVTLPAGARRRLIFAGSRDKDLAGMLEVLAPCFDHLILTRYEYHQRAVEPEALRAMLPAAVQARIDLTPTAAQAWALARQVSSPKDAICITGSVFLAGELRPSIDLPALCAADDPLQDTWTKTRE